MTFNLTKEDITIELISIKKGDDYIIILTGGDKPHIGAVTLSQSRPSLDDPSKSSASTSVLTALGHKEDILARDISQKISSKLKCNVSTICGIHLDNIKDHQFSIINELTNDLLAMFLDSIFQ